jgi:FtsH-binding integral membrane protein
VTETPLTAQDQTTARLRVGLVIGAVVAVLAIVLGLVNVFMGSPEFGWTVALVGVVLLAVVPVLAIATRVQRAR